MKNAKVCENTSIERFSTECRKQFRGCFGIAFTFTFIIIQAFPLYKAYMLEFGQVRKSS